jgi:magnesium transporter
VLSVHDADSQRLVPLATPSARCWVDVFAPSASERVTLRELGVPDALVADALDTDELARVDHHETGARLFVLRVPAAASATTEVVPLGVVTLPGGNVVTIAAADTGIPALLAAAGVDATTPTRFSLHLALHVAERFVATLHAIERDVMRLEQKLRQALENDEILSLLEQQKRLVHLDTALTANQLVLERAVHDPRLELSQADQVLVEDVLVELRQAGTMTRTKKEMLGETMDALATVVSNNLNVAMKKLASLTLLVAMPALIAGLYGMNVTLPFAHEPYVFPGLLILSASVIAALAIVLRRRRWL